MAKFTTKITKARSKTPIEVTKGQEALMELIRSWIQTDEPVFTPNSPVQGSVLLPDNTYRTASLMGNEELMLSGVRQGAKGGLIFEFKPMDAQTWTQIEFNEGKLAEIKGIESDLIALVNDAIDPDFAGDSKLTVNVGIDGVARPADNWIEHSRLFREFIEWRLEQESLTKEQIAQKEVEARYAHDEEWGQF